MAALFRQEAVSQRAVALFGGVRIAAARGSAVLSLIAMALAVGLVMVLIHGTYTRKEPAPGYVAPSGGLVRVYAPRAGLVSDVKVAEGQRVQALQPLFTVTSPLVTVSGISVDAARVDLLLQERASLAALIDQENELADATEVDARRRIADLGRQLASVAEQQAGTQERLELVRADVERLQALRERGHIAASLLDARLGELLDTKHGVHALEREAERIDSDVADLQSELRRVPLRRDLRLSELRTRQLAVDQALTEAELQWAAVVRAPVAGRAAAVLAHEGVAAAPDRPLLAIIPDGSTMQAELLVSTYAAGFVRPGQDVLLRYDAFPYQKFGLYRGTIRSVSRTVLNPEEQQGPVRLAVPAYRVIVALDSQTVAAYGEALPLQPGLTLQADIVRDRRRIIEWIFDPLLAVARRV